nr:potassium-transporting ATPase subunit B [Anaerolineae bacterium]
MAAELRNDPRALRARLYRRAFADSFAKLDPRRQVKNPVMFVTEVGALAVTLLAVRDIAAGASGWGFTTAIAAWLWLTVLFANFSEALAEGRGKAQAEALRRTRRDTQAKRVT